MIRLSIILPVMSLNEETAEMTKVMLSNVREEMEERDDMEIIVVDNASTHGQFYMRELADIYVRLPENRGWGGGLNVGMKLAKGEFFIFANNDMTITTGWADKLLERFASDPKIGTISINNKNGFAGYFFAIRREIYETIGDFDEKNFPLGHAQDCDYLYRLMYEGWSDNILIFAGIHHFGRRTYNQNEFKNKYLQHSNFSRSDFINKWGFKEGEWEARGRADWRKRILNDNKLDRYNEVAAMRETGENV